MKAYPPLPDEIVAKIERARKLEWITVAFVASIIIAVFPTIGSSQVMMTAWIEDVLSILPPLLWLGASHFERKKPTRQFPFGFHRSGSLAFFGAAAALCGLGLFLFYESVRTLIAADHPTVSAMNLFGFEIWFGWLMIAALIYSVIPPVILGRMKRKLALEIRDKVLFTDAEMNAADWKTGLAGVAGVLGLGMGWWWADALAAGFISVSIIKDGGQALMVAVAELLDGFPRETGGMGPSKTALDIKAQLQRDYPGQVVQLRETGRYMRALVTPQHTPGVVSEETAKGMAGDEAIWLIEASCSIESEVGTEEEEDE